jgi:hypothetical protein
VSVDAAKYGGMELSEMQRLKLDVARHVGIHGVPGTHDDFLKTLQTTK